MHRYRHAAVAAMLLAGAGAASAQTTVITASPRKRGPSSPPSRCN